MLVGTLWGWCGYIAGVLRFVCPNCQGVTLSSNVAMVTSRGDNCTVNGDQDCGSHNVAASWD